VNAAFAQADDVVALARGDAVALRHAYEAHRGALARLAHRLTGDAAAADDLVQETFLALPSALERFDARANTSLRNFLCGIVTNLARRHRRALARRLSLQARGAALEPAPPPTPEDHAGRAELATQLSSALAKLPAAQRDSLVLC